MGVGTEIGPNCQRGPIRGPEPGHTSESASRTFSCSCKHPHRETRGRLDSVLQVNVNVTGVKETYLNVLSWRSRGKERTKGSALLAW